MPYTHGKPCGACKPGYSCSRTLCGSMYIFRVEFKSLQCPCPITFQLNTNIIVMGWFGFFKSPQIN